MEKPSLYQTGQSAGPTRILPPTQTAGQWHISGAGLVLFNYGGYRITIEMDIRNRPVPLVASAEATGERGQSPDLLT